MIELSHQGGVAVTGLDIATGPQPPNRAAIHIFVNGRPVRSAALMFAAEDAMAGLLMIGRHPLAAISIALPPDQIDPNVHPSKQEVRFLADRPVFSAVRNAVRDAVSRTDHVRQPVSPLLGEARPELGAELDLPEPERRPYPEWSFAPDEAAPTPAPTFRQALPKLRVFWSSRPDIHRGRRSRRPVHDRPARRSQRILFDSLRGGEGSALRQPSWSPQKSS